MEAIFLKILNMSITASWLILGAMLVRFLFKKAPKSLRFIIWALVGARLILPFSFESAFSLIRSPEPIPQDIVISADPQINSGIGALNSFINPIISETMAPSAPVTPSLPQVSPSPTPMQSLTHTLSIIWICVMAAMLGYAAVTYLILRRRVRASVKTDGGAYICDGIDSPFVLGIIKPRIYLPSNLDERQAEHVLAHEKAHIRRRDHWWKPLSFVLLAVYWFNPLIWAAYVLLCRDIELACDERVARGMSDGERADYSSTLLELSIPRKMITACPVAFGEVSVKSRIRSVLSYKKPTLWIIIAALIACAVLTVTLFANPVSKEDEKDEPKQEEKDEPIKDEKEENKPDITPEWDTKYAAADSKDAVTPYFCLNETEKRYLFLYSGFSSHISEGSYELIGQDLIMLEDETEREYVFRKTEDGYSFDAAASSPMPEYKYSADSEPEVCIEDGTLFVINEEVVEPYTEEGEYWIIDRSANGDYSYTILDENKNSLLTDVKAQSEPTISYLGNGIVKVNFNADPSYTLTSSTYINIKTAERSTEMYSVIAENVNNGIVVYKYNTDSVVVSDMFDPAKLGFVVLLPDAAPVAADLITSCVINDDTTVLIKYLSGDNYTEKELTIDENTPALLLGNEFAVSGTSERVQLFTTQHATSVQNDKEYEYVLRYKGRDLSFKSSRRFDEGVYNKILITVRDLTGDGTEDIVIEFPDKAGAYGTAEIRVFDGKRLMEYTIEPISDILAKNVKLSSADKHYIEFGGDKYGFDRNIVTGNSGYEHILAFNNKMFSVSDGKLICKTSCDVVSYPLASLHTEYRFDGEKFVFGSMTIEPHEEYTIEDERTPETAVPAAKPSRAPETNVNTNTNANIDTPAPAPEPEEQTSGHTASGVPNSPENTSLQIGGVSSYYDDFEFGRTYGYFSDEKVYEPRNHDVPFNSEIEEEQTEPGVSEPPVEIISLIP